MSILDERISQLILPNSGQQFNCNDLNQLLGPGVYVFLKNEIPMYVGTGKNVLRRISGKHHKRDILTECDKLLIYPCNNINDAYELEALLIHGLRPPHNDKRRTVIIGKLMGLTSHDKLRHLT